MYKCINPYYSQYMTKRVGYGDTITPDQYYSLPPTEKIKFTSNEESASFSSSSSSSSDDTFWPSTPDTSTSWDFGSSSDSSSSDSGFDFGGGDGGGAGASGDW